MDILQLIQSNLLTPIILFFLFGIIAARIKSDLKIPEAISEFLPIYLLAAIGLHGGIEMRTHLVVDIKANDEVRALI